MSSESVLRVEGELGILCAAELKPRLLSAVEEIDLSGVTSMDTAGLQLLILAKREAVRAGRNIKLTRHSPAVLEIFDLLNVAAYFGDQLVMGPEGESGRN